MHNYTLKSPSKAIEIKAVAMLHHECINLGFLSKLGPKFLYYLYLSMQECEETELIIAKDKHGVIGFISGATTLKPVLYNMLRRHLFRVTLSIIPHLLSISNVRKLIELASYTSIVDSTDKHFEAELLSLAVKEEYRGTGVSQKLFSGLKEQFEEKGHKEFKIIVGEELTAAQKFYKKMGAMESGLINLHSNSPSILFTFKM